MNSTDSSARSTGKRTIRRVGTFTMGVVLVVSGIVMLVSMFYPNFDYTWVLKLSPIILICLGVETLLSARDGSRIKYDWVGMLLCFLIVCTALVLFCLAWVIINNPAGIHF